MAVLPDLFLDKVLVTGEYFSRFRSCGIETRQRDTEGDHQDLYHAPLAAGATRTSSRLPVCHRIVYPVTQKKLCRFNRLERDVSIMSL